VNLYDHGYDDARAVAPHDHEPDVTTFTAHNVNLGESIELSAAAGCEDDAFELFAQVVALQMLETGDPWTLTRSAR